MLQKSFSAEIYVSEGDKVIEDINRTVVPYKIFKTKLEYSRVY